MAYFVKFKEKKKLDNLDTLCCWCYEISRDDKQKFQPGDVWGLDLPIEIKIQEPRKYTTCNDYKLGAKGGSIEGELVHTQDTGGTQPDGASYWVPNVKLDKIAEKIEICFIATCIEKMNTEVSLEHWGTIPNTTKEGWNKVHIEGGSGVLGPAIATAPPDEQDILHLLAHYEGLKLVTLYSSAVFGRQ